MTIPIVGGVLKVVGDLLLPKAGKLLKGHLTNASGGLIVAGMAYAGVEAGSLVESLHSLIDIFDRAVALFQEAKPHFVILLGAIGLVAGWFRKAGHRAGQEG